MMLNGLMPHLEERDDFRSTMHGFRPHHSTQDVLWHLKEEVIYNLSPRSNSVILALHVKGEFDNVFHVVEVWTTAGLAGTKQDGLQEAVCRKDAFPRDCSVAFAPEESELLILQKRTRERRPPMQPDPELTLNGLTTARVNTIWVLGLNIQGCGAATTTG
ncbi:hypothetical protein HPB47_000336 [Ixodes persulcatus]|uniref:Uncharacterized protein n=1 Tax=Ixodes persulcatus TaxID=34615 RepID=A0AC60PS15_IXOPE|nr:hypothetical protein HPB47_000336 [Ixodes persulcatus]